MSGEVGGEAGREGILRRIREANRGREGVAHPGELPRDAGAPAPPAGEGAGAVRARTQAFARRLEASGGEVVILEGEEDARRWLGRFVRDFGRAAVSEAVDEALRPALPPAPPAEADLGVSRALAAAAQTGSLVLGSREGRRLQTLPPVHLVWVRATEIRATLGEALDAVRADLPAAVALHSGPSKSADIGRIVVTGVHGPGRLVAAVVGPPGGEGSGSGEGRGPHGHGAG